MGSKSWNQAEQDKKAICRDKRARLKVKSGYRRASHRGHGHPRDDQGAPGAKQEILKAFGIGTRTHCQSQPLTIAAANLIIAGYNKYSEWARNNAKILEEDIIKIEALRNQLIDADKIQENVKLVRKLGTVDKNTLQSRLEQLITQASVVGVKVFRSSKPELVPLFQALIPGSSTADVEENEEETVSA
jgi:hypothetical protein